MDCLGRYARRHGLPRALYVDKDSIYTVNNREPTGGGRSWPAASRRRSSAGRWRSWASRSSWPTARRPRAASSACTGRTRIAWSS